MTSDIDYASLDFGDFLAPPPPDAIIGRGRVTVLRSLRGLATKRFTPKDPEGQKFHLYKYFDCEEKPANNIRDLAGILAGIQGDPKALVIRGTPVGPQRDHVLRRSIGEDATFRDDLCHWICLDLDSVGDGKPDKPAAEVREVIETAPQLKGVTCVCQVSSSWGIKSGVRAHLWFWLEEPRTSQQVSEWASGLPFRVDHSLFGPVQPHYTADPVFEGVTDPLRGVNRVFLLDGSQSDSLYVPPGTAQAELDHWVSAIQSLDDDAPRHPVVNKAAYSLGGWVGAGSLTLDETHEVLYIACVESGVFEESRLSEIHREIESGLRDGAKRPRQCEDWKAGMIRNKDGAIKPLPDNFLRLFKSHPAMVEVLGYDVRADRPTLLKQPPWTTPKGGFPRGIRDVDDVEATAWVNRLGVHSSAVSQISGSLSAAAEANSIDPVKKWLGGLPAWDRKQRLFDWIIPATGCEDTLFARTAGGKFLISLVARAMRPGCKVDDMLVLVGPQGALKSTLFREVVRGPGDWAFTDCLGNIRKPQDYMPTLMGPWLVEVADLSQFTRREVEEVKRFLSTQSDRFRLSYGRRAVDIPRRGCLCGTSNTLDFLTDPTGNRRFWPVDVQKLDLDSVRQNRDQLFAEALHEYRKGTSWWMEGEEVDASIDAQQAHTVDDVWGERIHAYLDAPPVFGAIAEGSLIDRKEQVSVGEIIRDCLQIPAVSAQHTHSRRVGSILRQLGWVRCRAAAMFPGSPRPWVYRRKEEI